MPHDTGNDTFLGYRRKLTFKGIIMFKNGYATAALLVVAMGVAWQGTANALDDSIQPKQEEIDIANIVWQMMGDQKFAYLMKTRDEKLARAVVDRYLNALDPDHSVFLQSDIAKFRNKPMWSLAAMQGRAIVAPFHIYQIYQHRALLLLAVINSWKPSSEYTASDVWILDHSQDQWPSNEHEQRVVWQRFLDHIYLSGKTTPKAAQKIAATQRAVISRAISLHRSDVLEAFINSYVQSVDPHAAYMTPRSAEDMMITLSLSLDGIGAVLAEKNGSLVVDSVLPSGPAEKSGKIAVGDHILAIAKDGEHWTDTAGMSAYDAVSLIRGKSGSHVALRLAKGNSLLHSEDVNLVRDRIVMSQNGASEKMIDVDGKRIGWLRLPVFYGDWRQDGKAATSSAKDVGAALERLKSAHADGVILDLRDNGGGSLDEAIAVVGLFAPPSDVVQIVEADQKLTEMRSSQTAPVWSGPLFVLVNKASASASEITAGALQDDGRAVIVGEKTFGKGTVQSIIDLDRLADKPRPVMGQIKLSVAQFFLPSGRSTQLSGVVPDLRLPATFGVFDGEDQFKNAAPAASIAPVPGLVNPLWKTCLPLMQKQTSIRAAKSKEFQEWLVIRNEVAARESRKYVPMDPMLNIKQKQSDDAWTKHTKEELRQLGFIGKQQPDPVVTVAAQAMTDWLIFGCR